MNAFIGIASQGSGNLAAVAPGIATALVTTVAGLAVAIPAVMGYNLFRQPGRPVTKASSKGSGTRWWAGWRGRDCSRCRSAGIRASGGRGSVPVSDYINVTSLVDVAFVLLIIFMITAPMLQGGVDVQLPRAAARPLSVKEGLIVTVDRSGRVFVDKNGLSFEEFRASFRAILARRKPSGVYLRGDQRANYGDVVRVLAVIREAGIADVGLVAEDDQQ